MLRGDERPFDNLENERRLMLLVVFYLSSVLGPLTHDCSYLTSKRLVS